MIRRKPNKRRQKKIDYGAAVYYQRTKVFQEEFRLIGVVTERENLIQELETIIRDVKEGRKDCDDEVILQTFRLFNQVRSATIKVVNAIAVWQDSFTKNLRPTIFGGDYIVEKLITYINFVNASKMRKIFNFQLFRGNMLLLPFPNLKSESPIKVSPALGKEIREFAFPNEQDIVNAYNILYNCLSEDIFKEKLVSLQKWLLDPWVPRIWISNSNFDQKFFHPSGKPKTVEDYQKEENLKRDRKKSASPTHQGSVRNLNKLLSLSPLTIPKINEGTPKGRPTSPNALQLLSATTKSTPTTPTSRGTISPLSRRQSSLKELGSKSRSNDDQDDISPVVKLKRRNQLAPKQAELLKSFTNLNEIDDLLQKEELKAAQSVDEEELERQREIKELEDYYMSLEKQFLSSSPQRMALASPSRPGTAKPDRLLPDPMTKTGRIYFLHMDDDGSTVVNEEEEEEIAKQQAILKGKSEEHSASKSSNSRKVASVGGEERSDDEEEENEEDEENDGTTLQEEKDSKRLGSSEGNEKEEEADAFNSEVKPGAHRPSRILKKDSSRRISDLTVTFSVDGEDRRRKSDATASPTSRRSSSLRSGKRKGSNTTTSSSENSSTASTSTSKYKKNLSKIKLSTSFVREWYKMEG